MKSDCYINVHVDYSGKDVVVTARANEVVKSTIDVQVELFASYKYGGGETYGSTSVTIGSGTTLGETYEVATDIFGEAVRMESIGISDAYCYPEEDSYY